MSNPLSAVFRKVHSLDPILFGLLTLAIFFSYGRPSYASPPKPKFPFPLEIVDTVRVRCAAGVVEIQYRTTSKFSQVLEVKSDGRSDLEMRDQMNRVLGFNVLQGDGVGCTELNIPRLHFVVRPFPAQGKTCEARSIIVSRNPSNAKASEKLQLMQTAVQDCSMD